MSLSLSVIGVLALAAPVLEEGDEDIFSRRSLADLGLDDQRLAEARGRRLVAPLVTRVDQVLLRGQVQLRFRASAVPDDVVALAVDLNGERLVRLERATLLDEATARVVTLDPRLLSGRDTLGFELELEDPCAVPEVGAWRLLAGGAVETAGTPLPLPAALELLPLPFIDAAFEAEPELTVVMPSASPELLEAAALAVAGLGARTEGRLRIRVQRALPSGYALALVPSAEAAKALSLPFDGRPTAEIIDRPPDPRAKVLVLSGQGPEAVRAAAAGLFAEAGVTGPRAHFELRDRPARAAWPSRWVDAASPVSLEAAHGGALVHRGLRPGTLRASFRLSPDLFGWPTPTFLTELHVRREGSPEAPPLRLDVALNGQHVASIRAQPGERAERRVHVARESLRGFNELVVHVRPVGFDACAPLDDPTARLVIEATSALHLEAFDHHAVLPDVELFAFDGWPFTRFGGLDETAALLPPDPDPLEIASFLSIIGHFAAITGDLPLGLKVIASETAPRQLDRDLLIVGAFERHPALVAWRAHVPYEARAGRGFARAPSSSLPWGLSLDLPWFGPSELERASSVLATRRGVAALAGFASPIARNRSAVALTSATPETLPGVGAFLGFAAASRRGGDLMLAIPEDDIRTRHHIGPERATGELDPWTGVRWLVSRNAIVLGPILLLGIALLTFTVGAWLDRRLALRVASGGAR